MNFANLTVNRLIVHEVFKRDEERNIRPPQYAERLVVLDAEALDAFRDRVVKVLGSESRSIEMQIIRSGVGSVVQVVEDLLGCRDDAAFIVRSRAAADLLAQAQLRRDIPGGILVMFEGQVGYPAKRIIGLIKAEPQNGFNINFEFLKNLFMTPASRLYKVGVFVENDTNAAAQTDRFKSFVYDDLMTVTNRQSAAQYFYEAFLGCGFAATSARLTRDFHDFTKEFINNLAIPEEAKADLHTGLYAYLKVDQTPTIEVSTFARTYLSDAETQDDYLQFMTQERSFPAAAVRKDLAEVKTVLVNRKVRFNSNIRIIVPADKYEQLVHIETIDADGEDIARYGAEKWTRVTIRDQIAKLT